MKTIWHSIPQTIPPGAENYWFSPSVWLAFKNGSVRHGQCLHKQKGARYKKPVHSWFADRDSDGESCEISLLKCGDPIAWTEIIPPTYKQS